MAANYEGMMNVNKLVGEFLASYQESLTDQVSDADLAPLIIDSEFYAIREAQDQELFFATSSYLDEFLVSAVPPTVGFAMDRVTLWAKEALAFARNNVGHESFHEIFSSRLQYETVLLGLLHFDASGRFMKEYFRQVRIDSAYLGDVLPGAFQAAVQNAAREAIQPALFNLAGILKSHQKLGVSRSGTKIASTNIIRKSPSFLNKKGAVAFVEVDGRFRIEQGGMNERVSEYKPLIDRAIRKLVEARTFQRIDNKDRVLASLLSEYRDEVCRPFDKARISMIWAIGMELEKRVIRQNDIVDKDERLDEEDLFDLSRLLVSHNLFLNCFEQTASLLQDMEASSAIYRRIDAAAKKLPGALLKSLSENEDLVERSTAEILSKSISNGQSNSLVESKGEVALKLGLLRGLLHAAGGHLLGGVEKILSKAVTEVGSKALVRLMQADSSFAAALAFLHQQASALLELSNQIPIYFGYVRSLLALFGGGL